ncbi:UNVERIFIED_CONTAM: BURP domain-containing protein 3 [Sesamum radiatum]|uniref:BURP domain-containing protein 3 n=1 Tax=Sesamum radiatum TaxID=300843 RepID=A0AAW2TTB2_SESRA
MPKAIKDLLQPAAAAELGKTGATTMSVSGGAKTGKSVGGGGGKGVVTMGSGNEKGKRESVWINLSPPDPFFYSNRAGENQLQDDDDDDDPNAALFFMEKDLYPGKLMKLDFSKNGNRPPFFTRHDADSVPFSSDKLPEILSEFSVDPSSDEAEVMKKTIQGCEQIIKSVKGEEKFCATSLESMIDFATSKLGKDVDAISTSAVETVVDNLRRYRIVRVKQMPPGKRVVACHLQQYPYAVFYCHKMAETSTVGYKVWMVAGEGSTQVEAVAVCHRDTAAWSPMHLVFQVNPGGAPPPVCHFLPVDHLLWVSKN